MGRIGKRFGMLTVVSYAGKENGFHIWHCKCDCGKEIDVRQSNLQNGWTWSCGCQRDPQKNLHYADGTCLEMLRPDLMYKTNTSGVRGIYFSNKRNKWIAQIMFKQKCYYLGGYDRIEEAAFQLLLFIAALVSPCFSDFTNLLLTLPS